jgi:hypothetical protein
MLTDKENWMDYLPGPNAKVISTDLSSTLACASLERLTRLVDEIESALENGEEFCESPRATLMFVCFRLCEGIDFSEQKSVISEIVGQRNSDFWSVRDCIQIARSLILYKSQYPPERFNRSKECERRKRQIAKRNISSVAPQNQ